MTCFKTNLVTRICFIYLTQFGEKKDIRKSNQLQNVPGKNFIFDHIIILQLIGEGEWNRAHVGNTLKLLLHFKQEGSLVFGRTRYFLLFLPEQIPKSVEKGYVHTPTN